MDKLKFFVTLAIIPFFFSMCIQDDDPDIFSLKIGDPLPEFSVKDNHGITVSTSTLKDKVSLIAFVNTGCPDCRAELPELEKAYQQLNNNRNIQFIVISRAQGYESMTQYWTDNHFTLPYSAQDDATIFNKFASRNIPRIYIASSDGIIRFTSDDSKLITTAILIEQIKRIELL